MSEPCPKYGVCRFTQQFIEYLREAKDNPKLYQEIVDAIGESGVKVCESKCNNNK